MGAGMTIPETRTATIKAVRKSWLQPLLVDLSFQLCRQGSLDQAVVFFANKHLYISAFLTDSVGNQTLEERIQIGISKTKPYWQSHTIRLSEKDKFLTAVQALHACLISEVKDLIQVLSTAQTQERNTMCLVDRIKYPPKRQGV